MGMTAENEVGDGLEPDRDAGSSTPGCVIVKCCTWLLSASSI